MSGIEEGWIDIEGRLPRGHPENRPEDRPLGAIKRIVVHYDGVRRPEKYDPIVRYVGEAKYHIGKNWGAAGKAPVYGFGLMYHLKIDGWGRVYLCNGFEKVLWHARVANYDGLAVCVDLGEGQEPTGEQLRALREVLVHLCYERPDFPAGRRDVWGHCEVKTNWTVCPGSLLRWVRMFRAGEW